MRIASLGARFARTAERVIPDPLAIAVGLFVLALALAAARVGLQPAIASVLRGMLEPSLLAFGFQMALILVGGHALADARAVRRALTWVASLPRTTSQAAALVALSSTVLGLLNWGLGLVGGALLAREVRVSFARRRAPLSVSLVSAAGFMGLLVWHGGLSGSAPLKVASAGSFGEAIPVSSTIFSPMNVFVTIALLVALPALFFALGTSSEDERVPDVVDESVDTTARESTSSRALSILLAVPLFAALALAVVDKGPASVTLDFVILLFFAAGLVLHGGVLSYQRAFTSGVESATGVLLQFPIYFAVLALVQASGALTALAQAMVAATHHLPLAVDDAAALLTFWSAAIINVLVPSGGGQWVLQSPVMLETATTLDVAREKLVMAFAYGDELTNMLQPFWALPLLAITGQRAGQVMGYTMLAMLVALPIMSIGIVLF